MTDIQPTNLRPSASHMEPNSQRRVMTANPDHQHSPKVHTMTAKDELVQIIWDGAVADRVKDGKDPERVPVVRPKVEALADAILAAGYRKPKIINTVVELDTLPVGSIVRTSGDEDRLEPRVALKTSTLGKLSFWAVADEDEFESSSDELDDLPATVLYEPQP